jgi:steroid delta-isomerase-like uncharacterized protein
MSTEQNKAVVRQLIEEVMNRGNISLVDEIMPPDFVDHEGVPGLPPTREGFKQSVPMLRSGIPDFNATIDDVVAEGDRVVIRMTWRGTQTGEFMGMPPTGKSISVGVIDISRIAEGKIVEHWGLADMIGMMQQLGAMPAPGASGS